MVIVLALLAVLACGLIAARIISRRIERWADAMIFSFGLYSIAEELARRRHREEGDAPDDGTIYRVDRGASQVWDGESPDYCDLEPSFSCPAEDREMSHVEGSMLQTRVVEHVR